MREKRWSIEKIERRRVVPRFSESKRRVRLAPVNFLTTESDSDAAPPTTKVAGTPLSLKPLPTVPNTTLAMPKSAVEEQTTQEQTPSSSHETSAGDVSHPPTSQRKMKTCKLNLISLLDP